MRKKIIVIGCTGQDGSYLTKSLLKKGFEPIGISRSNKPQTNNHEKIGIKNEFKIIKVEKLLTCEIINSEGVVAVTSGVWKILKS